MLGFDETYLLLGFFVLAILLVLVRSRRVSDTQRRRNDPHSWTHDGDAGDGGSD
ncbi:MAG: hypothetical protein AAFR46_15760 [Pseudomonadota bacterium]